MLSHSIIAQKKHSDFIFSTDLESDDIVSILQFAQFLKELNTKGEVKQSNVAFLVGEGNSAIKVERLKKYLTHLQSLGFFQQCELQIIRGYSHHWGPQKDFKTDGQESLSQEEIQQILQKEAANEAKQDIGDYENNLQMIAQNQIVDFLSKYPNTAMINLKPPRELIDISKSPEKKAVLSKSVYYGTGSYNHRALFDPKKKKACQDELLGLLKQFKETFVFETYSAHESNSTSMKNAPALFGMLASAKPKESLYFLAKFIDLWGDHLLAADRAALPKQLAQLVEAKQINKEEEKALLTMFNDKRAHISDDQFSHYKKMFASLGNKIENANKTVTALLAADREMLPTKLTQLIEAKQIDVEQGKALLTTLGDKIDNINEDQMTQCKKMLESLLTKNNETLTCLQKIGRLLGKWANITECDRQFVNADPALTAVLFGHCSQASFNMAKTAISFNGDYTVLSEAKEQASNIHICLPGNLSVMEYNNLRNSEKELKEKPASLKEAQKFLFSEVQNSLLKTIKIIHEETQQLAQSEQSNLIAKSVFSGSKEVAREKPLSVADPAAKLEAASARL
jgi:hypothetical protein